MDSKLKRLREWVLKQAADGDWDNYSEGISDMAKAAVIEIDRLLAEPEPAAPDSGLLEAAQFVLDMAEMLGDDFDVKYPEMRDVHDGPSLDRECEKRLRAAIAAERARRKP
jgi:hypothetical protein